MDKNRGKPDATEPVSAKDSSERTPEELARIFKRKYEEWSKAADEVDKRIEAENAAFEEQAAKDGLVWTTDLELNTKRELADEYYEQWQAQLKKMGKSDSDIILPESSTDEE
jgi:hypothetical protein